MSVTFHRAQLVKVAQAALAEHEKAKIVYAQSYDQCKADHAAAHHETYRAQVTTLRNYLTRAIQRGGPINRAEIRKHLGVGDIENLFYYGANDYDVRNSVTRPTGLLSPAEVVETRALLSVLEAATGETISANELKLLGLKNLQPVFVAASASPTPAAENVANRARR